VNAWSSPQTVAGFARSAANPTLLEIARGLRGRGGFRCLDIGCGAARNAVALARDGWHVLGTDVSWPMLRAAVDRTNAEAPGARTLFAAAPMDRLPVADGWADLVIAHGIWNLAHSASEFRDAVRDAARAARPGACLFLFTFSRTTLPASVAPLPGEPFVFTQFSGEPQCFLTEPQILAEMAAAGFVPDSSLPLHELNRPAGPIRTTSGPVIWEATFQRVARHT
jgi:SAM-dependent methyltransferase